jgi:DNA-directed RNA polymerase sigma subunit (sigma70/sigma32)
MTDMKIQVSELRQRYVDALATVEQASDRAIGALEDARRWWDVARNLVATGRPLVDLEQVIDPSPLRASLSDALADLERTRHAAQRLLYQLLHAEGQTLADIGRTYGISRQLVSRLVNEPDSDVSPSN